MLGHFFSVFLHSESVISWKKTIYVFTGATSKKSIWSILCFLKYYMLKLCEERKLINIIESHDWSLAISKYPCRFHICKCIILFLETIWLQEIAIICTCLQFRLDLSKFITAIVLVPAEEGITYISFYAYFFSNSLAIIIMSIFLGNCRQNKALDHLDDDVEEINFRVRGANIRGRRLLGK